MKGNLKSFEFFFKVWIEVLSGGVRSNDNMYVHFIGILLRADTNWNINERIYQEEKQRS